MRVLVTGSSGLLGSKLIRELSGHEVLGISRKNGFDLNDEKLVESTFREFAPDLIYHLAAEVKTPTEFLNNIGSTWNICRFAPRGVRIVFSSSVAVYGTSSEDNHFNEDSQTRPTTPYGLSKLLCEHIIKFSKNPYTILRFCAVVGKGMVHGALPDIIRKVKCGDTVNLIGKRPGSKRPYIHVDDAVRSLLYFRNDSVINICNEDFPSIEAIYDMVCGKLGVSRNLKWSGKFWENDNPLVKVSNRKMRTMGFSTSYKSMDSICKAIEEII
jgi:nucleoside-diphosphate-sugar epimerase